MNRRTPFADALMVEGARFTASLTANAAHAVAAVVVGGERARLGRKSNHLPLAFSAIAVGSRPPFASENKTFEISPRTPMLCVVA